MNQETQRLYATLTPQNKQAVAVKIEALLIQQVKQLEDTDVPENTNHGYSI